MPQSDIKDSIRDHYYNSIVKVRRSTYTEHNATCVKPYFDLVYERKGTVLIPENVFGGVVCKNETTLYKKIADGLLWLREHGTDEARERYNIIKSMTRFVSQRKDPCGVLVLWKSKLKVTYLHPIISSAMNQIARSESKLSNRDHNALKESADIIVEQLVVKGDIHPDFDPLWKEKMSAYLETETGKFEAKGLSLTLSQMQFYKDVFRKNNIAAKVEQTFIRIIK